MEKQQFSFFSAFAEMSACYKHIKSHKVSENTTKDDTTNADDISTLIVENNLYKDGGIVLVSVYSKSCFYEIQEHEDRVYVSIIY